MSDVHRECIYCRMAGPPGSNGIASSPRERHGHQDPENLARPSFARAIRQGTPPDYSCAVCGASACCEEGAQEAETRGQVRQYVQGESQYVGAKGGNSFHLFCAQRLLRLVNEPAFANMQSGLRVISE